MSIARTAVRGAAWTIATGLGSRVLGLVGTLVITRFIAPDVYGEVSAASVVVLLANQFSTVGLGQYLIAKPDSGKDVAFHATFYHLLFGAVALGAVVLLRGPLGPLFKAPAMGAFVPLLALATMIDRLGFVPERLLVRDMRFRSVGLARTGGELSYTLVSVGLAALGWGGMAIVWGNVARAVVRAGWFIALVERPAWLTPSAIRADTSRAMFAFGVPLSLGAFAGIASRRVDNLLMSGFFGPGVMGAYNLAYNLADIPAVQVGEQIGDVLLPSFAKMEPKQRVDALVRSTAILSLLMFPLAVGLGAVAPTATAVFFDKRWADVAPMLIILSALSVVRPIGWTIGSYLMARDRTRAFMWLEGFKLVALVVCIVALAPFGAFAACGAVGLAFGLHSVASMWVVKRLDGPRLSRFFTGALGPLLACVPMVLAIIGVRKGLLLLGVHWRAVILGAEVAVGGLVYVGAALVLARSVSQEFLRLVRNALRRRDP